VPILGSGGFTWEVSHLLFLSNRILERRSPLNTGDAGILDPTGDTEGEEDHQPPPGQTNLSQGTGATIGGALVIYIVRVIEDIFPEVSILV
jgi:hypothetical protein